MYEYDNYLMHYGVKGMKWGKRKAKYEYTYAYGQKPKNAYQKVARSLGGTKLAKGAIKISGMSDAQKKNALKEQAILADEKAYNKAAKKAHKTGGQMTYDVATGKYSVSKPAKADALTPYQQERKRQKQHIARKRAITAGTSFVNNYLSSQGKNLRVDNLGTIAKFALDKKYMNDTFK